MSPAIARRIETIRLDHSSGAAALTALAAAILIDLAAAPGATAAQIETAALELVAAQPSMASMFNLADQVLWRAATPAAVVSVCREVLRSLEENVAYIAQEAGRLIAPGATVLTHSSSSTVRETLIQAHKDGKSIRVIATEARPVCEGRAMARALSAAGIPVTLIIDAAVARFVSDADLVLVGADAVSPKGLLNKIGTRALALSAQAAGKPFYSLCDSSKILRGDIRLPEEPRQDPFEVLPEPIAGATVANYYFEWTPLRLITGVVIEGGTYTPDELQESTREVVLHPALARQNAGV